MGASSSSSSSSSCGCCFLLFLPHAPRRFSPFPCLAAALPLPLPPVSFAPVSSVSYSLSPVSSIPPPASSPVSSFLPFSSVSSRFSPFSSVSSSSVSSNIPPIPSISPSSSICFINPSFNQISSVSCLCLSPPPCTFSLRTSFKRSDCSLIIIRPKCSSVDFSFSLTSAAVSMKEEKNENLLSLSIIQHSEVEDKIFGTLKAVLNQFDLDTQLRVAGGWVRDKLLGKESYDIDIAIDNMLGEEFCNKVNEYLKSIDEEVSGVGVILSNPDQSKHLETARMRMFGVWIDFVNLRSETYANHSRIPATKFGSPEEDAYRRDLTINSLFYNINTCTVEDFTGRGLVDLRAGTIATPLPAKTTFLDDPLRVLRAIRFAARLNYKIDEDLKQAAADEEVKIALANKVSLERIGVEADLMIMCAYPVRAIQELVNFNVFWTVFRLPLDLKPHVPEEMQRICLITLKGVSEVLNIFGFSKLTAEQRRISYFSAVLLPLRAIMYQDRRKKQIPVASVIMKESLKLKSKDAEQVASLHKAAEDFEKITDILLEKTQESCKAEKDWEESTFSKKVISAGMLLWEVKDLWRVALLLSSVLKIPLSIDDDDQEACKRADLCSAVEEVIVNLGLDNVWNQKPLLDGKVIMAELGLTKGGPKIKEWQDRIRKWHLCHLEATTDECLEWFKEECLRETKTCDDNPTEKGNEG